MVIQGPDDWVSLLQPFCSHIEARFCEHTFDIQDLKRIQSAWFKILQNILMLLCYLLRCLISKGVIFNFCWIFALKACNLSNKSSYLIRPRPGSQIFYLTVHIQHTKIKLDHKINLCLLLKQNKTSYLNEDNSTEHSSSLRASC